MMSVRRLGVGTALSGGVTVTAAIIASGIAYADGGTDEINGWAVTPTNVSDSGVLTTPATLSDPSDSLGLGTAPITGGFASVPYPPPGIGLSSIGSNDQFVTPFSTLEQPGNLFINNAWMPGLELASVQRGFGDNFSATGAVLALSHNGKEVVDLFQISSPDQPIPLFNPDATGPIDVGGVELASPQDGALLNNLFDALFLGDTAGWDKAATLFDDWTGIDLSGATAAVDPGGVAAAAANGALASNADDPLSQASANLAEASSLITAQPDVSPAAILNLFGVIDGAVGAGFGQGIAQKAVQQLQSAEAVISAHDGSLSNQVDQLFFDPLNQDWDTTSAALLHADQAYEAALTSGSGLNVADSSLFTADLQALGDAFYSAPVLDAANLIGHNSSVEAGAGSLSGATTSDGLLATAISNLTEADKLLNAATGVDATQPLSFNNDALQLLDQLQSAQDTISAHDGSLSSLVDQLFFVPLDQGWVDASEAALHGAQELTATTASGLDIGLEVPSLQLVGDYFASVPVVLAADLF